MVFFKFIFGFGNIVLRCKNGKVS